MGIEQRCSLPFDVSVQPIRISQGNNGPWSHYVIRNEIVGHPGVFSQRDLVYAVDFALPFGTQVRAARDGQVHGLILTSDWYYEGLDPEIGNNAPPLSTNLVILSHCDGTLTLYSHLSREVLVRTGQSVKEGEIIAKTGKTGWIGEVPHLHFQVCTQTIPVRSIPLSFGDYGGPLDHQELAKAGLVWFGK